MLFILVTFLAFAAVSGMLAFFVTRMRLSSEWRRAGPKPIADALERRNRALLLVLGIILVVVAFFEAIVPTIAYAVQDIQADTIGESLPAWALLEVGNGSISWLLYLAVLAGITAGITFGTLRALRIFPELGAVGALDVI
jgi:hypothetical protein